MWTCPWFAEMLTANILLGWLGGQENNFSKKGNLSFYSSMTTPFRDFSLINLAVTLLHQLLQGEFCSRLGFLFFSNSGIDPNICQNMSGCILGKSVFKWLGTQREYSQLIRWCGHKKKKKKHGALGFDISLGVYFIQLRWRVETSWHRIYDAIGWAVLNIFLTLKLHIKENTA